MKIITIMNKNYLSGLGIHPRVTEIRINHARYSPNDQTVLPKNALRVAQEVPTCELYEVPSDTHLIWIGKTANDVWQKRLAFLKSS